MEFTGKTLEEAKAAAFAQLGITEEQAEITVVEEPVKGLFGRMKGKAVVDVKKKETAKKTDTVAFVQDILDMLGYDVKAELNRDGENTTITLKGADANNVIGYRGEVLDAIQTLAGAAENIGNKDYKKVVVDCENYRDKREETLVRLAHRLEEKATEMRRDVMLEPMNPFERRIIHTALADSATVTTKSEGKEPNRYVLIVPNDRDENARPYNAGRNKEKNFKRGFKDDRRGGKRNDRGDRGDRGDRRDGRNGKRGGGSGFTEQKRKSPSGFGTYLGNSLKDKN